MCDFIQTNRGGSHDICEDHGKKVVSFCLMCTTFVCNDCYKHLCHDSFVKEFKEAAKILQGQLSSIIADSNEIISRTNQFISENPEADKYKQIDIIINAISKCQYCTTVSLFLKLAEIYKNFIDDKYEKIRRLKYLYNNCSTLHSETDPQAFISECLSTLREVRVLAVSLNTDDQESAFISFIRNHTNAQAIPSSGEIDQLADEMSKILDITSVECPTITVNILTHENKRLKSEILNLKSQLKSNVYGSCTGNHVFLNRSACEVHKNEETIKAGAQKTKEGEAYTRSLIERLESDIASKDSTISELKKKVEQAELQWKTQEMELQECSRQVDTVQSKMNQLIDQRVKMEEIELRSLEFEIKNLKRSVHEKERALENSKQQIEGQTALIQKLNLKLQSMKTDLMQSHARVHEKERALENSKHQIEEQTATIQKLNLKLQSMKTDLMQSHAREQNTSQKYESAQTKINQLVDQSNELETKIKKLKSEEDIIQTSVHSKEAALKNCSQKMKSLEKELKESHARGQESTRNYESARTEINQLVVTTNELEIKIHKLKSEKDDLQTRLIRSIDETEKVQTHSVQTIYEQTSTIQRLESMLKDKEKELHARTQEISRINESAQRKINQHVEQSNKLENKIQELKLEKDDLQTRLSSVAGQKLTSKNPAITNLADPNRPMKVGERYGELYDNDWTDAMERITIIQQYCPGKSDSEVEEIVIHYLHRIVRCCYEGCLELARRQISDVFKILGYDQHEVQHADEPTINDLVSFRQKNAGHFAKKLIRKKAFYDEILDGWDYPLKHEGILKELIDCPFYDKCLELCWYMVIQDPVMYIDDAIPAGAVINKDMYREFTKSGKKVAFVVWPALLLHKNGPVLYKGVVQVK